MPKVSPKAIVEKGADLAKDVVVGPFAYIGPDVKIGAGCIIENNATITGHTRLEGRNHVFPLAVVGISDSSAGDGWCHVGPANAIREHVTIYGGTKDAPTEIGTDNLIMIGCQLGASCIVGDHGVFANCTHVGRKAIVEDYVRTAGFAVVEQGVMVGAYTFMTGYAQIDVDAPPFSIVQGFPFRVRGINSELLKRCGFGDDDIRQLKKIFRELFNGTSSRPDAAAAKKFLKTVGDSEPLQRLGRFLQRQAVRGGADA